VFTLPVSAAAKKRKSRRSAAGRLPRRRPPPLLGQPIWRPDPGRTCVPVDDAARAGRERSELARECERVSGVCGPRVNEFARLDRAGPRERVVWGRARRRRLLPVWYLELPRLARWWWSSGRGLARPARLFAVHRLNRPVRARSDVLASQVFPGNSGTDLPVRRNPWS
jgi:hypothetical protein